MISTPLKIRAVLFPNFELLDVFGPLELFGALGERVSIEMLAETPGQIRSAQGPQCLADLSFLETTAPDVLLIPGGHGTRDGVKNPYFLEQLRILAEKSHLVATVCTGSALLAKTGLLDGKQATSNKQAFEWVCEQGPHVTWIRKARWIEDGKFFTSSGVSAGMDMALALIAHLFGREESLRIARYAEYLWNEKSSHDPFQAS